MTTPVEIDPCGYHPGLSVWKFIEDDINNTSTLIEHIKATGGDMFNKLGQDAILEGNIKAIVNLGELESKFIDWMLTNKTEVIKTSLHDKFDGSALEQGFVARNTTIYTWGAKFNEDIKELIGGREAFKKMEIDYDRALCDVVVSMPGQMRPLSYDNFEGWAEVNRDLNPQTFTADEFVADIKAGGSRYDLADKTVCDNGKIVKRLVNVSEWTALQLFELENARFPNWASGDVYNIPAGIWNCGFNASTHNLITIGITSVEEKST